MTVDTNSSALSVGNVWSKGLYPLYSNGRKILEYPINTGVDKIGALARAVACCADGGQEFARNSKAILGQVKVVSDVGNRIGQSAPIFSALLIPLALVDLTVKVKDVVEHFFGVNLADVIKNPIDTATEAVELGQSLKRTGLTRDHVWTFIKDRTKKCGADALEICGIVGNVFLAISDLFVALEYFSLAGQAVVSIAPGLAAVGGVLSGVGLVSSGIQGFQTVKLRYEIQKLQWKKGSENSEAYDEIVDLLSKQDNWTLERVGLSDWNSKAQEIQGLRSSGELKEVVVAKSFALANSAKEMLNRQLVHRAMTMTVHFLGLASLGIILGTLFSGGVLAPATLIALGVVAGFSVAISVAALAYKLTCLNASGDPTSLTYLPFAVANKKFVVDTLCGGNGFAEIGQSEQKLANEFKAKCQKDKNDSPVEYWLKSAYGHLFEGQWVHDLVMKRRRALVA